jgi:hypothetical protein
MVFPVWRRHQERMAEQLKRRLLESIAPAVHVFRFPRITINHGLLVYDCAETDQGPEFVAYDPNIPAQPAKLLFDRAQRTFVYPPACYWAGGPLNAIEIYRGGFY